MRHPCLGELEWKPEGWWEGKWQVPEGPLLEFCVAGDLLGPVEVLVPPLQETLSDWAEVWSRAEAHLEWRLAEVPQADSSDFTPTAVLYLWKSRPDYFMIDLSLEGDPYGIWKLEFEDGQPKYLSRDD